MVKHFSIEFSDTAKKDLQGIYYFYKETENRKLADYVTKGIIKAINSATIFPHKHKIEPYLNNKNIRFTVKWHYKIIFAIHENSIKIVRVFHTSQDPNKIKEAD